MFPIRIEYSSKKETSSLNRYTGQTTIKNLDALEGSVIGLDHFNTNSQSLLVYATNKVL